MLPKLDVPIYTVNLVSSGKPVRFRPFLVKEQKNLLMAMESDDSNSVHNAVRDVLNNCSLTEFDIDELPIVDIEYYFLQLRAKSVGEIVESRYRCNNEVDGNVCNTIMEENVNLNDITVEMQPDVSPEIQITDKFVVRFKYPLFGVVKNAML